MSLDYSHINASKSFEPTERCRSTAQPVPGAPCGRARPAVLRGQPFRRCGEHPQAARPVDQRHRAGRLLPGVRRTRHHRRAGPSAPPPCAPRRLPAHLDRPARTAHRRDRRPLPGPDAPSAKATSWRSTPRPLPADAISELFGVPEGEREGFREAADDIASALSGGDLALYRRPRNGWATPSTAASSSARRCWTGRALRPRSP